jgi:hypothetical protein
VGNTFYLLDSFHRSRQGTQIYIFLLLQEDAPWLQGGKYSKENMRWKVYEPQKSGRNATGYL